MYFVITLLPLNPALNRPIGHTPVPKPYPYHTSTAAKGFYNTTWTQ